MPDSQNDLTIRLRLDRAQARAEQRRFVDEQKSAEREVATAAESAERARTAAARREARGRSQAAAEASAGVRSAAQRERDAHEAAGQSGAAGMARLGAAAAVAQVGLQMLVDLAGKLGQAVSDAGDKSRKLTEAFGDQRDSNRELAALMGRKNDSAFTLDVARFNARAGLSRAEGREFLTAMYNAGGQYEGKTIEGPEFEQYKDLTARFALAKGYAMKETGDVAGTVLGFTDYRRLGDQAAETALGKTASASAILQRGKGDFPVLARQFSMLTSASLSEDALKGTFQDSDEVAAVISAAAEKSDAGAAELAKIAGRGLRDFKNPLVQKAGVTPKDSFTQAFAKIAKVADAEVAARQASTPGFKTEDYLREQLDDEGVIDAFNVFLNKGVAGGAFADRAALAKTEGAAAALDLVRSRDLDEDLTLRRARAGVELAETERGAVNSPLEIVRKQVLSELVKQRKIDTNATNLKDYLIGTTSFGLLGSGEQVRIDEAVQRKLIERNGGKDDQSWSDYLNFSPTAREDDLMRRIERIRKRGGDPLRDATGAFAAPFTPTATPAMGAAPASAALEASAQAAAAAATGSAEGVQLLREVRDELRKANEKAPPPAPPAPMPGGPAVVYR